MTPMQPREHVCRMRDGTELRGQFWECAAPAGLVVIRTPYDARQHAATARSWSARGYHCLIQDVRGRYRSGGDWTAYQHEEDDGGQVLTQLGREHPGLPIVLFGASYAAHAALEAARGAAHVGSVTVAAVIVLVPALGLAETAWDSSGTPQIRHRIGWWHEHGRTRCAQNPLSAAELARRTAEADDAGVVDAAKNWGWTPHALAQWRRLWQAERIDLAARYDLGIPLLVISGDDDFFDNDARRLARTWTAASHFVTGPWGHRLAGDIADPELRSRFRAAGGLGGIIEAWLSAHDLSGTAAGWTEVLRDAPHTRSTLDPADGAWRHERTAP
ncbi:hypothetical protein BA062_34900 [Prauserella flavalba]|uniref:Xaa-Pro dipeptidyl-peptidase-like domain-containing protein n=2 Tax=Prauserella flavalba TaxID=1477506 RepID=A0A318LGD8_9PSEU|nr:hypothetical protein BA062_34900 [Prauserella flavalba]